MKYVVLLLAVVAASVACSDARDTDDTSPPPPVLDPQAELFPASLGGESIQVTLADGSGPNLGVTPKVGEIADVAWVAESSVLRFAIWEPGDRWSVYLFHANQLDA